MEPLNHTKKASTKEHERKQWLVVALLAGVIYFVVGFGFAALARRQTLNQTQTIWNQLAFAVSAVVFATHIVYEHFRLGSRAIMTAWHASVAAALGAFGLALAANLHDLASPAGYRPRMLIALFAWPIITGVPAFLAGFVLASGLRLMRQQTGVNK